MKNWLKDPLIHFVLLGAALFIGHGLWTKHVTQTEYHIEISQAEIERQLKIIAVENNRPPSEQDALDVKRALFEEQALVREAIRLGLNEDDTIIDRRLAQKMRFMIEDQRPLERPDDAALQAWFDNNLDRFTRPPARSFRHVYISQSDGSGEDGAARASTIRDQITQENWRAIGDPFSLQSEYNLLDRAATARLFGNRFASAVFEIDAGVWSAPIESEFGLHLVYVDDAREQTTPQFADVKTEIAQSWLEEARQASNRKALEALLKLYKPIDTP